MSFRNFFLWYLPQAAVFAWGYWFAATSEGPPTSGFSHMMFGLMLAAAYTGGVNLIIDISARLRSRKAR